MALGAMLVMGLDMMAATLPGVAKTDTPVLHRSRMRGCGQLRPNVSSCVWKQQYTMT
jgi:hypothetical protein